VLREKNSRVEGT